MNEAHHGPLGNGYVLLSLLGFLLGFAIWSLSESWGFLLILISLITFIASFISATRAPLLSDEEMELAIHEKYAGNRYPDTGLHHGMIKKGKYMHSRHKKKLVELHVAEESAKNKQATKKKSAKKKPVAKKPARKAAAKKVSPQKTKRTVRTAVKKQVKRQVKKTVKKALARKTAKKSARKKSAPKKAVKKSRR